MQSANQVKELLSKRVMRRNKLAVDTAAFKFQTTSKRHLAGLQVETC